MGVLTAHQPRRCPRGVGVARQHSHLSAEYVVSAAGDHISRVAAGGHSAHLAGRDTGRDAAGVHIHRPGRSLRPLRTR